MQELDSWTKLKTPKFLIDKTVIARYIPSSDVGCTALIVLFL